MEVEVWVEVEIAAWVGAVVLVAGVPELNKLLYVSIQCIHSSLNGRTNRPIDITSLKLVYDMILLHIFNSYRTPYNFMLTPAVDGDGDPGMY